jgi:D-ribose pyranase
MAQEFLEHNPESARWPFGQVLAGLPVSHEPHADFKRRVPTAIGLIRTGDAIPYANVIIESG